MSSGTGFTNSLLFIGYLLDISLGEASLRILKKNHLYFL